MTLKLGDYLLARGSIKPAELHAALAEQAVTGEKLGLVLNRNGFISRSDLIAAILQLAPSRIHGEQVFSNHVPPEYLAEMSTMVVAETATTAYLATLKPERQVRIALAPYYPDRELKFVPVSPDRIEQYLNDLARMHSDAEHLVERLIRQALLMNVSDIHIMPKYGSFSVFYRYLGVNEHAHEGSLEDYLTLAARIKDMAKMDLAEKRLPQDGGFQLEHNGRLVDLRVVTLPVVDGEKIVIRLLDPERAQPSLAGLGLTRMDDWVAGIGRTDGLCLICGPTGSGKTTTLSATIKEMNRFALSVNTLEDPVEYRIPFVAQINVNASVGLDFAKGIRAFMRADPDVIVVGEVRDAETARNAIKGAETGHLMLATLHTGSIPGAVQRMRDLEIPIFELKSVLRSVLAQRLVRSVCTHCKGKGCTTCMNTGYGGRIPVSECAYFSSEADVERMLAGERWWPTLLDDAILKMQQGQTDKRELERVFGIREVELALAKGAT